VESAQHAVLTFVDEVFDSMENALKHVCKVTFISQGHNLVKLLISPGNDL